jgi:hypothetical protein
MKSYAVIVIDSNTSEELAGLGEGESQTVMKLLEG